MQQGFNNSGPMLHPSLAMFPGNNMGMGMMTPTNNPNGGAFNPMMMNMNNSGQQQFGDMHRTASFQSGATAGDAASNSTGAGGRKVKVKQADGTFKIMALGPDGKPHPLSRSASPSMASGAMTPNGSTSPAMTLRKVAKKPPATPQGQSMPAPSPFGASVGSATPMMGMNNYLSPNSNYGGAFLGSPPGDVAAMITASAAGLSWRDRFTRFYQQYAPDKMDKVETCMTMEAGPEAVMAALEQKYGPEPLVKRPEQTAAGGGGAGLGASVTSRSPSVATGAKMVVKRLVKKAAPKPSSAQQSLAPSPASRSLGAEGGLPPMEDLNAVLGSSPPSLGAAAAPSPKTKKALKKKPAAKKAVGTGAASRALGNLLKDLRTKDSDSDSDGGSGEDEDDGDEAAEDEPPAVVAPAAQPPAKKALTSPLDPPKSNEEGDDASPLNAETLTQTFVYNTATGRSSPTPKTLTSPPAITINDASPTPNRGSNKGPAATALGAKLSGLRARSSDSDSDDASAGEDNNKSGRDDRDEDEGDEKESDPFGGGAASGGGAARKPSPTHARVDTDPYSSVSKPFADAARDDGDEGIGFLDNLIHSSTAKPKATTAPSEVSAADNDGSDSDNDGGRRSASAASSNSKALPSVSVTSGGRQMIPNTQPPSMMDDSATTQQQKGNTQQQAAARAALASTPTRTATGMSTLGSRRSSITQLPMEGSRRDSNSDDNGLRPVGRGPLAPPSRSSSAPRGNSGANSRSNSATRSGGYERPTLTSSSRRPQRSSSVERNTRSGTSYEGDRNRGGPNNATSQMLNSIRSKTPPNNNSNNRRQNSEPAPQEPTPWPLRPYGGGGASNRPTSTDRRYGSSSARNEPHNHPQQLQQRPSSTTRYGSASRYGSSTRDATPTPSRGGSARRRAAPVAPNAPHIVFIDRGTFTPNISRPPPMDEVFGVKRSDVRCSVRIGPPPASSSRKRLSSSSGRGDGGGEEDGGGDDPMNHSRTSGGSRTPIRSRSGRYESPNARRMHAASQALSTNAYRNMRGEEISDVAKTLHRMAKNSKYSYFDGLSADTFSTFAGKDSPQSRRPSPWAVAPAAGGNGAKVARVQKTLYRAKEIDEMRSPNSNNGNRYNNSNSNSSGNNYNQYGRGGGDSDDDGHGEGEEGDDRTTPRHYIASYYDRDRGGDGYYNAYREDSVRHNTPNVADLISHSRRVIRTSRGLSVEPQDADDIDPFTGGGSSASKRGKAVGIDGMDGVDEIVFTKDITNAPFSAGGGRMRSNSRSTGGGNGMVRREAQTILRADQEAVMCVVREVPRDPEMVKRQRDLSERLSKPKTLFVSRDVVISKKH